MKEPDPEEPNVLVFVVEDEPLVHAVVQDALQDSGYAVELATRGDEAIRRLEAPDARYDALITDVNLGPSLTGWDVARRARELFPLLPVVYTTGATAAEWGANGVPNSVLINKPFAPAQIVTAVSQLLNQTNTSPAAAGG